MLDNYRIPGRNRKISLVLPLTRQDLSGQTSSTDTVTTGNKPKTLAVALTLAFRRAVDLRRLVATAQALDENGVPKIYVISDPLAEALDIRQVEFAGDFRVDEQENLQAWSVRFSLREHLSVPEKREQRLPEYDPLAVPADGETVSATQETQGQQGQQGAAVISRDLTGFEAFLSRIDQALDRTGPTYRANR